MKKPTNPLIKVRINLAAPMRTLISQHNRLTHALEFIEAEIWRREDVEEARYNSFDLEGKRKKLERSIERWREQVFGPRDPDYSEIECLAKQAKEEARRYTKVRRNQERRARYDGEPRHLSQVTSLPL